MVHISYNIFEDLEDRYICDVLEDMRRCNKVRNYGPLLSLIEECQILAQKLEDKLHLYKDQDWRIRELKELKKERKELKKEILDLQNKRHKLKKKRK